MKANPNLPNRVITRHTSNEGSVITLDMYGKTVDLFVADAKYRAVKQWAPSKIGIPALGNFMPDQIRINPDDRDDASNVALPYSLTDSQLQDRFPSLKADKTAKENTNILMSCEDATAAYYCRNQIISGIGRLDLPNIYELMVIYLESDRLDELDPTIDSYPQYALGKKNPQGRFSFDGIGVSWSSTEGNRSTRACCVFWNGIALFLTKDTCCGVIPVKELFVTPTDQPPANQIQLNISPDVKSRVIINIGI